MDKMKPSHTMTINQRTYFVLMFAPPDMLLDDTGGEGGMRKEGRHVKIVVSLEEDSKWTEVRQFSKVHPKPSLQLVRLLNQLLLFFFLLQERRLRNFLIGCIGVSGKTKWDVLDGVVRRLFKVSEVQNKKTVLDPHQLFCNLRN